ncbi:General vesicular transport factor p115 [Blattella germanica]|nr:General vesicular transport factor p115 [Blattella germanica]
MEYFKSGLKSVLGAPPEGSQPTGAETVERLVDRVQSSTLLDDRRDACRALKALSRKYRIEVGAQGMDALRQVLEMDRGDCEIVGYALDALCNVTAPESFDDEEKSRLSRPKDIQEIILVSPMGVSKLMDLLGDSREVIRNDALLLLIQLTKGNANIQKIVAFENAFDRLFDVIAEEGHLDGGIVVEDCLLLMLNLLRRSYIQRLAPMFNLPSDGDDAGWSAQKVSNIHCMLQVVRTLVTPGNPAQVTLSSQRTMKACGLLEALCNILMASGVPADILTETINTVAECYLFKNEIGQSQLVQTLLPSSTEVASLTTGQLLCGGLFSGDALSNWFSAVALSHALVENPAQKEQLLRVLLATNIGSPPVSLLHQCTMLLQQGNKMQSKLGLLMLLSTWLTHCPLAVKQFLSIPTSIPFLTAQTGSNEHDDNEELVQGMCAFLMGICVQYNDDSVPSFSKEKLRQLVEKRLGLETFLDKLGEVSKHELYSKAAKHPQLRPKQPSELLLDHEFCRLFKAVEGIVVKAVTPKPQDDMVNGSSELSMSASENSLLQQYKDLIREQDRKLQELSQTTQVEDLTSTVSQLRDENMLLRVQANTNGNGVDVNRWKIECENKDNLIRRLVDDDDVDLEEEAEGLGLEDEESA